MINTLIKSSYSRCVKQRPLAHMPTLSTNLQLKVMEQPP